MTVADFVNLISTNNIPQDVELLSDSGWECGETGIGAAYYNEEKQIIFTQGGKYEADCYNAGSRYFAYRRENGWEMLFITE